MDENKEATVTFSHEVEEEVENRFILQTVYDALIEKGYDPVSQIVGYLLSEDPTYITSYKNARSLICKVDRDEILSSMLKKYLDIQ